MTTNHEGSRASRGASYLNSHEENGPAYNTGREAQHAASPERGESPSDRQDGNATRDTQADRYDAIRQRRNNKVAGIRERKTMRQRMQELTQSMSDRLDARHARKQSRDIQGARRKATASTIQEKAFNAHATALAERSAESQERDNAYKERYQEQEGVLGTIEADLAGLNTYREQLLSERDEIVAGIDDVNDRIGSDEDIEAAAKKHAKTILKSYKGAAREFKANSKRSTTAEDRSAAQEDDSSDAENEEAATPDTRSEAAKKRDEKVERARARQPLHRRFGGAVLGAMDRRSARKQSRDVRKARREATADTIVARETDNAIIELESQREKLQEELAWREENQLAPINDEIARIDARIAKKETEREIQVENMNSFGEQINANRQHILSNAEIAKRSKRHSKQALRTRKANAAYLVNERKRLDQTPEASQTEDDDMEQAA